MNNSGKIRRSREQTFVNKLVKIIDQYSHRKLIYWNQDGNSFIIPNITAFTDTVLPEHFKHVNTSSFIRQLNMYGFHKKNRIVKNINGVSVDPSEQVWEFEHPNFIRGRADLLSLIKRNTVNEGISRSETKPITSKVTAFDTSNITERWALELVERVQQLESSLRTALNDIDICHDNLAIQNKWIHDLFRATHTDPHQPPPNNQYGHGEQFHHFVPEQQFYPTPNIQVIAPQDSFLNPEFNYLNNEYSSCMSSPGNSNFDESTMMPQQHISPLLLPRGSPVPNTK